MAKTINKKGMPEAYIDRDLSWMYFNRRILQEATKPNIPLLERLSFLGIYSNNLDEFFRVRMATLSRIAEYEDKSVRKESEHAAQLIKQITKLNNKYAKEYEAAIHEVTECLRRENIFLLKDNELSEDQQTFVRQFFRQKLSGFVNPVWLSAVKELTEAKETSTTRIIVGETGCGKSYTVERFRLAYPLGTYVVTCNQNDTISDLTRKIQKALKVSFEGSISYRIDRISVELSRIADNGQRPILILDEAEYLSTRGLLSIKTIYDYLKGVCAIVLIGTDDILNKLERTRRKEGMPQFIRRFKAGIRHVRPIDRTFGKFLDGKGYGKDLVRLLRMNADNYGELADYLEPAIREADRQGKELTKEFFESMFYLQNR